MNYYLIAATYLMIGFSLEMIFLYVSGFSSVAGQWFAEEPFTFLFLMIVSIVNPLEWIITIRYLYAAYNHNLIDTDSEEYARIIEEISKKLDSNK